MNYERFETIRFSTKERIAEIILNRPEVHNSVNYQMASDIAEALKLCRDDEIKVVVLRGEGKSFCSGADIRAFIEMYNNPQKLTEFGDIFHNGIIKAIRELPKPVIAEAKGYIFGGGLSIILASDYAIASEDTTFSSGFARIGLSPDTGSSFFFPRATTMKRAFELMSTARRFDAKEALGYGIVTEVVPPTSLEARVNEVAKMYLRMPSKVIASIKQLLNVSYSNNLEEHLKLEMEHVMRTARTEDFREGIKAFIEKREPEFK
jgi:2-(1,2-epoxy-1,2-dihydrophenyl)acetyl-CoA isomerase